jgi:hypothetical protein
MTGDSKPGDAVADKWSEEFEKNRKDTDLALTRLEVRADLKSSGEEELSDVIDQETLARQAAKSDTPASANPMIVVLTIAKKFPPMGAVIVALALIAAYVLLHLKR